MYSKIKAQIKVGSWLYEWIFDESGTNQGGPLSPNMFRKLLSNLKEFLDKKIGDAESTTRMKDVIFFNLRGNTYNRVVYHHCKPCTGISFSYL